jgi:putative ABC transport system permease protein
MLRNYLRIGLRNLIRHKGYSLIHLAGLSVSLIVTVLLLGFIRYEQSFDDFHEQKDRIYRLIVEAELGRGKVLKAPMASLHSLGWVRNEIPEVEYIVPFDINPRSLQYKEKSIDNVMGAYTDSCFFCVFSFPLAKGSPETALEKPNSIVLTQKLAHRIFKDDDPMGKILHYNNRPHEVTGVVASIPGNSHMDFHFLVSVESLPNKEQYYENRGPSAYIYFMLHNDVNTPENAEKVAKFIEKRTNELYAQMGLKVTHEAQGLNDIHLHSSDMRYNMGEVGSIKHIYIMGALAFFLILIAVINYVNMETARAQTRMREIGVRKVSGAMKKQLVSQFMTESSLLVVFSFIIAMLGVELLTPSYEQLMNRSFEGFLLAPANLLIYLCVALLVAVISGLYPAFILASYNPIRIFRATSRGGSGKSTLRIILVVLQFAIATFLIIDLLILYRQVEFAKEKELGFAKEQVLVLRGFTSRLNEKQELLAEELRALPSTIDVSVASGFPGQMSMHNAMGRVDQAQEEQMIVKVNRADPHYQSTLDFKMNEGRYFREGAADSNSVVLNEKLVEMLGFSPPVVGKEIMYRRERHRVIGVMEDYHVEDLHKEISPIMHTTYRAHGGGYVLARVAPQNIDETLKSIQKVAHSIDPAYEFSYIFLDDYFGRMYQEEERLNRITLLSAFLGILIALLGLYALTSFTVLRKRKEIGIRKAMGSEVRQVIFMLLREINQWVILAILIACPVAYVFMDKWLTNFAYSISVTWEFFVIGGLITLLIAVSIVTARAWRAANENPSITLRDE